MDPKRFDLPPKYNAYFIQDILYIFTYHVPPVLFVIFKFLISV